MVDGKPRIGDEVYIHGYIDEIRNDVVIIRNEGGYFGTSDREIFYYEEDERGYGTMNEADRKTENSSEKPNNCEHISEDGVTCARYPACDDCPDNPLNKVKGSEKLLKGKDEPMKTTDYCDICKQDMCEICIADATNPYCVPSHYEISYEPKDEPQTDCAWGKCK